MLQLPAQFLPAMLLQNSALLMLYRSCCWARLFIEIMHASCINVASHRLQGHTYQDAEDRVLSCCASACIASCSNWILFEPTNCSCSRMLFVRQNAPCHCTAALSACVLRLLQVSSLTPIKLRYGACCAKGRCCQADVQQCSHYP
jgi:hypothetical protein